jgi:hypothetical protein
MEILIGTFDIIDLLLIISFAILEKNMYSKVWRKECRKVEFINIC